MKNSIKKLLIAIGCFFLFKSYSQNLEFVNKINSLLNENKNLSLYTSIRKSKITGNFFFDLTFSDNNIQYLKIRNGNILFDNTNVVIVLDSTKILMVTLFNLCAADLFIKNKVDSLTGYVFKINTIENPYNVYLFNSRIIIKDLVFSAKDRITIYEPRDYEKNLFLAPSFFLNSPINLILSKKYKSYFLNQLLLKLKNVKSEKIKARPRKLSFLSS